MTIDAEVRGLEEAQARMVELLREIGAGGGLEAIIGRATLRAHRYATMIVHVDTGRLKNSLYPRVTGKGNDVYGVVGTNVVYAPIEEARGGGHAFFGRTVREEGPAIVEQVQRDVKRAVRRAGGG